MSSVTAKTVHVKAVPVNGLVQFVESELTPQQLSRLLASMPPERSRYLTGHLLATEVVPLDVINEFTERAANEKHEAVKTFARRAGRFGAEQGLRTVYKFILMVLSIEAVLKKAPFMWTRVYDGGEMTVEAGESTAKIRMRDFPAHPAGCGRITGWFELIGERAGAKDLHVSHSSCMAEGGSECVWSFVWRK
jgi:hypothetical protein